jgi:hypothetical protein
LLGCCLLKLVSVVLFWLHNYRLHIIELALYWVDLTCMTWVTWQVCLFLWSSTTASDHWYVTIEGSTFLFFWGKIFFDSCAFWFILLLPFWYHWFMYLCFLILFHNIYLCFVCWPVLNGRVVVVAWHIWQDSIWIQDLIFLFQSCLPLWYYSGKRFYAFIFSFKFYVDAFHIFEDLKLYLFGFYFSLTVKVSVHKCFVCCKPLCRYGMSYKDLQARQVLIEMCVSQWSFSSQKS